jgi:hypothetical protein
MSAVSDVVARFFVVQFTKTGKNIPNDHKLYQSAITYLYQMAGKLTKWPLHVPICIQASSIAKTFKIYPNWDFGFENKPSGNPGLREARHKGRHNLKKAG